MSQLHNKYYQYSNDTDRLLHKYNISHEGNCPERHIEMGLKELIVSIMILSFFNVVYYIIIYLIKSIFQ